MWMSQMAAYKNLGLSESIARSIHPRLLADVQDQLPGVSTVHRAVDAARGLGPIGVAQGTGINDVGVGRCSA